MKPEISGVKAKRLISCFQKVQYGLCLSIIYYAAISAGCFWHCQGKGLEIRFLCHGTEKTRITSHISLAMTSHMAVSEGARECRLFVQKGEKNGVGEHCILLPHIGHCNIFLEWNLGNKVWYYEYPGGDSKFPGTQVCFPFFCILANIFCFLCC